MPKGLTEKDSVICENIVSNDVHENVITLENWAKLANGNLIFSKGQLTL